MVIRSGADDEEDLAAALLLIGVAQGLADALQRVGGLDRGGQLAGGEQADQLAEGPGDLLARGVLEPGGEPEAAQDEEPVRPLDPGRERDGADPYAATLTASPACPAAVPPRPTPGRVGEPRSLTPARLPVYQAAP